MTERELIAVQRALGHLRHCRKTGSLSPHDAGLVGSAIRELEGVSSGGEAPVTEEALLALGGQWGYPDGIYFRPARDAGRELSFHAGECGWKVLYADGSEALRGLVYVPTPADVGGARRLLDALQLGPPWWECPPAPEGLMERCREVLRRMREEKPEPFDLRGESNDQG